VKGKWNGDRGRRGRQPEKPPQRNDTRWVPKPWTSPAARKQKKGPPIGGPEKDGGKMQLDSKEEKQKDRVASPTSDWNPLPPALKGAKERGPLHADISVRTVEKGKEQPSKKNFKIGPSPGAISWFKVGQSPRAGLGKNKEECELAELLITWGAQCGLPHRGPWMNEYGEIRKNKKTHDGARQ